MAVRIERCDSLNYMYIGLDVYESGFTVYNLFLDNT